MKGVSVREQSNGEIKETKLLPQELQALANNIPGGIFSYSADEREEFSFISENLLQLLGYSREEFLRKFHNRFSQMIYEKDRASALHKILQEADPDRQLDAFDSCEYRIETADGSLRWFHDEGHLITDEAGRKWYYVILIDITEAKETAEEQKLLLSCVRLLNSADSFAVITDRLLQNMCSYYQGSECFVLLRAEDQLAADSVRKCRQLENGDFSFSSALLAKKDVQTLLGLFVGHEQGLKIENLEQLRGHEGLYRYLQDRGSTGLMMVPICENGKLSGFLGVNYVNTQGKKLETLIDLTYFARNEMVKRRTKRKLQILSYVDYMTQLQSRNAYNERLDAAQKKHPVNVGVAFADLNSLKYINDHFGHTYGDQLLQHMGGLLRAYFPDKSIYRISGDEFVVVCEACRQDWFYRRLDILRSKICCKGDEIASIGALWEAHPHSLPEMIYKAERLMYVNKQRFYAENPDRFSKHRSEILSFFLSQVREEQFFFYLQPIIETQEQHLVGAEVLVRRQTAGGQVLLPYDFIPLLENEGLLPRLDRLIFNQTCELMSKWQQSGGPTLPLSVNCSRMTVGEADFLDSYVQCCRDHKIDPSRIQLEITGACMNQDQTHLKELLADLKKAGFSILIDDLGVEYSFLPMMTWDGVDCIKFDEGLVSQLHRGNKIHLMMDNIIDLCHRLGQKCGASGIEVPDQMEVMKNLHCDYVQGSLFGSAMPVKNFEQRFLK